MPLPKAMLFASKAADGPAPLLESEEYFQPMRLGPGWFHDIVGPAAACATGAEGTRNNVLTTAAIVSREIHSIAFDEMRNLFHELKGFKALPLHKSGWALWFCILNIPYNFALYTSNRNYFQFARLCDYRLY